MPQVLNVITKIATELNPIAFKALRAIYGFDTEVRLPNDGTYDPETREGSIYNNQDAEYRYNENADFTERLVYSNLMPLSRIRGTSLMDEYGMDPVAYTINKDIVEFSRLTVLYAGKNYEFKVQKVIVLESPNEENVLEGMPCESIRKLELLPFT